MLLCRFSTHKHVLSFRFIQDKYTSHVIQYQLSILRYPYDNIKILPWYLLCDFDRRNLDYNFLSVLLFWTAHSLSREVILNCSVFVSVYFYLSKV